MQLLVVLLLLCIPGSLSLSGPSTVTGAVGDSLSVECRYEEEYRAFHKYWCRQPRFPLWQRTVQTSGPEVEAKSGRVSITDPPEDLAFTVTLESLTADDAGKYRCGVATSLKEEGLLSFLPDPFFQVQVIVSPGDRQLAGKSRGQDTVLHPPQFFTPASIAASSSNSSAWTSGSPSQQQGPLLGSTHFLLLVFLKVPLLLGMLGAVLWVNRPQRAVCGETEPV
ncbi:PREDICTED: CMRF35-like molecule 2 isoform X1 [Capra hircus]|uniref:CMRF35-like molecule 2 isoform X1 n=1 Tax=Capra hircus TaxID=9925 RepID=UPI0008463565|nr:PREDICTED: CMRF35-like molecule 2 isoform X1 [Capra hircus]